MTDMIVTVSVEYKGILASFTDDDMYGGNPRYAAEVVEKRVAAAGLVVSSMIVGAHGDIRDSEPEMDKWTYPLGKRK